MAKSTVACFMCLTMWSASVSAGTIVRTSEKDGQLWRYTFDKPSGRWFENDFDDSGWLAGRGGFGTKQTPDAVVGTLWSTADIWLRRTFKLSELPEDPVLRIHYDEDPSVYVNGKLIAELSDWSTHYESLDIDADALKSLRVGTNVLAVHCHQTYGGQFIDVGIESVNRWPRSRARNWQKRYGWLCGFNYIPSNAISYTEMWMGYSFDPKRIDAELALAENVGFNCLRVVLPYVVWEGEQEAFKDRLRRFLSICDKRRIKVMFTLFDDCAFGPISDPVFGRQPAVVEGWYANGWTPSPGHSMVRDQTKWPKLQAYVHDIIDTFKDDSRVFCWDLYNEPTNGGLGNISIPLLEQVFQWARRIEPSQPLTVATWNTNGNLNDVIVRHSDVITFHSYGNAETLEAVIKNVKRYNRPIICTEWLKRSGRSVVKNSVPVFRRYNVGCMHWGLVNGKTQTDLPWGHRPGDSEPQVWQHDLYHEDFTPYDPEEIRVFKEQIRESQFSPGNRPQQMQHNCNQERLAQRKNVSHLKCSADFRGSAGAVFLI